MAPPRFPLSVFLSRSQEHIFRLLGREPIPCPHPERRRVLDIGVVFRVFPIAQFRLSRFAEHSPQRPRAPDWWTRARPRMFRSMGGFVRASGEKFRCRVGRGCQLFPDEQTALVEFKGLPCPDGWERPFFPSRPNRGCCFAAEGSFAKDLAFSRPVRVQRFGPRAAWHDRRQFDSTCCSFSLRCRRRPPPARSPS
jgi:hypothetical protein